MLVIALIVVALISVFVLFGLLIASADDDQGAKVPRDNGVHIDISDDFGLHVRKVMINGRKCFVATTSDGVGIDCPEQ